MVATKRRNRHLMIIIPSAFVMILAFQNCAMDMAPTTPGAASLSCNPDTTTLAAFETVFNSTLNSTGTFASGTMKCAGCHGDASNPNGEGGYIIYQGNTATDPSLVERNFCASFDKGATLVNHPMSGSHAGGLYPQSDIQDLVTFVNTYF